MPRVARVIYSGVPHHVTQRGNRRGQVFFCDHDRAVYLKLLRDYADKHQIEILAYCLMTNHVHLVVLPQTADGLHRALKPLHMRHAQRINRIHGWQGHLWQGRYFSSPLDDDYLWAAIRYVEVNPVRAQIAARAEDYPWSSAAAHCGLATGQVLTANLAWQRRCRAIGDWSRWLAAGEEPRTVETLRRHANKGLPCGSAAFISLLEETAGRPLRERPRGRPIKG
ncbi:MAG: transposase [Gammaproteobacteria bacterium]